MAQPPRAVMPREVISCWKGREGVKGGWKEEEGGGGLREGGGRKGGA